VTLSEQTIHSLINSAIAVQQLAHAPYSHFKVGAALLCENDMMVVGCNVENCSYSLSICAERTALSSAVAQGLKDFRAIAIVGGDSSVPPCGACRQVLSEFNREMLLILASDPDSYRIVSLSDIYPAPFTASFLERL